jgi:hypothetical protein
VAAEEHRMEKEWNMTHDDRLFTEGFIAGIVFAILFWIQIGIWRDEYRRRRSDANGKKL